MGEWKTSWGYCPINLYNEDITIENETQRIFVRNNLTGRKLRLRFSNRYGAVPMVFERVLVSRAVNGHMVPGTSRNATFDGNQQLILSPGQERFSDELGIQVNCDEDLMISTYVAGPMLVTCGSVTTSKKMVQVKNSIEGDFCDAAEFPVKDQADYLTVVQADRLENQGTFFYGLCGVDVLTEVDACTIAAFGDSITQQAHWCGALAERLYHAFPGKVSVVNCGIGGNRILHDAASAEVVSYGDAGIHRFERDLFRGAPIDLVLTMEGVNDLFHPFDTAPRSEEVSAEDMIGGLQKYAQIAHENGAAIVGCTILPFGDPRWHWTPEMEQKRLEVNRWILTNQEYDGGLDFDQVVRDPQCVSRLKEEFHCGDHLHLGALGGQQLADSVDLDWLIHLALCHKRQ